MTLHAMAAVLPAIAYKASTGSLLWKDAVEPLTSAAITGCSGENTSFNRLEDFAVTPNGEWGLFVFAGGTNEIVNLTNGTIRSDASAAGVLGNFILTSPGGIKPTWDSNPSGSASSGEVTDPATGASVATIPMGSVANCSTNFYDSNAAEIAPMGLFDTPSASSWPGGGITSDGSHLLYENEGVGCGNVTLVDATLPTFVSTWSIPVPANSDNFGLIGDAGGVVLAFENSSISGIDDSTGKELWTLPGTSQYGGEFASNGQTAICGVSTTQMMLSVNNQLAVINLRSGRQVSYNSTTGGSCPEFLPGGMGITQGAVTQILTP